MSDRKISMGYVDETPRVLTRGRPKDQNQRRRQDNGRRGHRVTEDLKMLSWGLEDEKNQWPRNSDIL